MGKIAIPLLLFLSATCAFRSILTLSGLQGSAPQNSRQPYVEELGSLSRLRPRLRRETRVPARLPEFLPLVDEKHPIYAVIQSLDSSGYRILLANDVPCEGQNWCLYGSVEGRINPFESKEGPTETIKLRDGIVGEFIDAACDAYCTQAYVRWKEDGFYYSVGIKAERRQIMIKVANSAIRANVKAIPWSWAPGNWKILCDLGG